MTSGIVWSVGNHYFKLCVGNVAHDVFIRILNCSKICMFPIYDDSVDFYFQRL